MNPAAFDAGRVAIRLGVAEGRVANVSIASERPQAAAVLRGKSADEAVRLLPLLFSLCSGAQGRAAVLALAAARGAAVEPHLDAAVQAETLREHLWRLLLDLPPLLGLIPQRELFLAGLRMIAAGDRAGVRAFLSASFWSELRTRLEAADQPPAIGSSWLPNLTAQDSLVAWPRLTAAFAARPDWHGDPAETGAIARCGSPAVSGAYAALWLARVEEIAQWAAGEEKVGSPGTASAIGSGPGIGRALLATARGLLMHEIVLDGECVADYVIVAPTEWNFHPQGRLAGWLTGMPAEGIEKPLAQAVAALDPCVRWELETGWPD